MKHKKSLDIVINKIERFFHPLTIFLFGSRSRNDYLNKSDYEIGVLFDQKKYVNEDKLNKVIKPPHNVRIYPYKYEKFIKREVDIPFQVNIFLREIITTGKTLKGKKIIEKITPPPIRVIDLMQDLKFSLARGSDAIISYRNGDRKTASVLFYKSCLFGTRSLVILSLKKFPKTYLEICRLSKKLKLKGEYKKLINLAYEIRRGESLLKEKSLFENIIYLNKFIEKKLNRYYKKWGNKILIN